MNGTILKRLLFLLSWGVFTATVIYPLLHESGHIAAGAAMGAQGIKAGVKNGIYVSLEFLDSDPVKRLITGIGGMLMPLAVAVFLPRRRFFCWYTRLILLMCCELSFAVSLISALFGINPQDDYHSSATPGTASGVWYTALCAVLFIILFFCIKMQKPIDRILSDCVFKQGKNKRECL